LFHSWWILQLFWGFCNERGAFLSMECPHLNESIVFAAPSTKNGSLPSQWCCSGKKKEKPDARIKIMQTSRSKRKYTNWLVEWRGDNISCIMNEVKHWLVGVGSWSCADARS
jgi:hypothetical protein